MSYRSILAAIQEKLEGVEGIKDGAAKVYDYQRLKPNYMEFLDCFKTTEGKIHGWVVTRKAVYDHLAVNVERWRYHHFVFRGYLALDDSAGSEKHFQDVIENICADFAADMDLSNGGDVEAAPVSPGYDDNDRQIGMCMVTQINHQLLGQVLCHFCEIEYHCKEYLTDIAV